MKMCDRQAYGIAAASGATLWILTSVISGRREAWDASFYWTLTYPVGLVIAGILGFIAWERPWRWGLTLMLVQALTLAVTAGSFGLLPLGLIMFGILALPPIGVAAIAARLGRRAA
jgi:hypothetical protein